MMIVLLSGVILQEKGSLFVCRTNQNVQLLSAGNG